MAWYLAKSLVQFREQVNTLFPHRDKSSDGSVGDTSHKARKSDHNPNAAGAVCAIDIDADLAPNVSVDVIVKALQAAKDKRLKYIIWNGRITVKGDVTKWKPYTGPNAHRHHAHISVLSDPKLYDDSSAWDLTKILPSGIESTPTITPNTPQPMTVLKLGDVGSLVVALQKALGIKADGDFGKQTQAAVINFQKSKGLKADGRAGDLTRKALGLI